MVDGEENGGTRCGNAQAAFDEPFKVLFERECDFVKAAKTGGIADDGIEEDVIFGAFGEVFKNVFGDKTVSLQIDVILFKIEAAALKCSRCGVNACCRSHVW